MNNKCIKCPARGNFNGCMCYLANSPSECELTYNEIINLINDAEDEIEEFYDSY